MDPRRPAAAAKVRAIDERLARELDVYLYDAMKAETPEAFELAITNAQGALGDLSFELAELLTPPESTPTLDAHVSVAPPEDPTLR